MIKLFQNVYNSNKSVCQCLLAKRVLWNVIIIVVIFHSISLKSVSGQFDYRRQQSENVEYIMTSVGDILDYTRKEDEDYYSILGCDENSSVSRILRLLS